MNAGDKNITTNFATLIRSSKALRSTFHGVAGWSVWWRLVLALHGQPTHVGIEPARETAIICQGVGSYGRLLLLLAILLALGCGVRLATGYATSDYWGWVYGLVALWLAAIAQLASHGRKLLERGERRGGILLVVCFVEAIVVLTAAGALASAEARKLWPEHVGWNVLALTLFMLFGVGSHFFSGTDLSAAILVGCRQCGKGGRVTMQVYRRRSA